MAFLSLLLTALLLHLLDPSGADDRNIFLTGEVLHTGSQLSNNFAYVVMEGDCNLALYNKADDNWKSNTHGGGVNCTLSLNNHGQLVVKSATGVDVWHTSTPNSKPGKYAAVLRRDGQLAVYGPSVWSTALPTSNAKSIFDPEKTMRPIFDPEKGTNPIFDPETAMNLLFSAQTLPNGAKLTARDFTISFIMRPDCGLALVKASAGDVWTSGTKGKGKNCSASLDRKGMLNVESDGHKHLWGSQTTGSNPVGDYVLVLQMNGQAVIYGPMIWSTLSG